jgi:hypothetical protein
MQLHPLGALYAPPPTRSPTHTQGHPPSHAKACSPRPATDAPHPTLTTNDQLNHQLFATRSGLRTDWIGVSGDIGRMCPATDSQVLELDRFATICADCLHVQLAAAAVAELDSLCAISAPAALGDHLACDADVQHNPRFVDGVSGLVTALGALAEQGITMKYNGIRQVVAEGDFAYLRSEGGAALSARFHYVDYTTDQPRQFPQHQPATRTTASNTFRAS